MTPLGQSRFRFCAPAARHPLWLYLVIFFASSLAPQAVAKVYKINGLVKDHSAELRGMSERKKLFLNLEDIQNRLPVEVIDDSLSRLTVLAGIQDCAPVFYDDADEYRANSEGSFVAVGRLAQAFGSRHWAVKKKSVTFENTMMSSWLRPGADSARVAPGFVLTDQKNQTFALHTHRHGNGVVIAFVRSALWDPFSQELLRVLEANRQNLEKSGYRVAAIHGYEPSNSKAWADSLKLSLPLLADSYGAVMRGYRCFDKGTNPVPSIFIVNLDGTIIWKKFYRGEETFDVTEILDRVRIRE